MIIIPLIEDTEGNELRWNTDIESYREIPVVLTSVTYCGDWGDGDHPKLIMRFKMTSDQGKK